MSEAIMVNPRSAAALLVLALAAVPALAAAGPPECRVRPLGAAERSALYEAALRRAMEWPLPLEGPASSGQRPGGFPADSKPGVVPAIGIEIADPTVCLP
uniref:hypothetical protein n=1 Tax=Herbidospora sakaeratensis TaxID=564415 RepID=UPI0012FA7BD7|nr:hypothetical protein [Herbidospora sakaeratensis]